MVIRYDDSKVDLSDQLNVTSPTSASPQYNQGDNHQRQANNDVGGIGLEVDNHRMSEEPMTVHKVGYLIGSLAKG